MKNVLIIGSKGFIGSHVVNNFSASKDLVVFTADVIKDGSEDYIHFSTPKNEHERDIIEKKDFDFIINCRGSSNVQFSFEEPVKDFTLNTLNVLKILDGIKNNCPNTTFINLSSAAVYGNPTKLPISENHEVSPISPYGFHKKTAEDICQEYSKLYNIKTVNLRIFSAYGNGLEKQIFWDLTNKFLKDPQVNLFGTGKETRDFIHIDDICEIIKLLITTTKEIPSILNVANGEQVSIERVANLVKQNLNSTKEIIFNQNTRSGDPSFWQADVQKLFDLGYKKSVLLEDGVEKYVKWAMQKINDSK